MAKICIIQSKTRKNELMMSKFCSKKTFLRVLVVAKPRKKA